MTDDDDDFDSHAGKRTASRLTMRQCKGALHSGTSYSSAQGKPLPRVEILWDAEVRGLGLRLLPSGRKTWVLRYRHPITTKQHMKDLGDFGTFTLDQARTRARRSLAKLEDGEDPFSRRENSTTLGSFEGDFSESCRARVEATEIASSTAAKYAESFEALREVLGTHRLDEINGQVARCAFTEISKRRGRYAANRALSTLNTILKLAVDAGYRSSSAPNPIADVKRNREVPRGLGFSGDELAAR